MTIMREYRAVETAVRAASKAGFSVALNVAVLLEANQRLPKPADAAIFRERGILNRNALAHYRAPEKIIREYLGEMLGGDFAKATASRGWNNGRALYSKRATMVERACAAPGDGTDRPDPAARVAALAAALRAEGVATESALARFVTEGDAPPREKSHAEKAATALAALLKAAGDDAALIALAIKALEAARDGAADRAGDFVAAMAATPKADAVADAEAAADAAADDIPLGLPEAA